MDNLWKEQALINDARSWTKNRDSFDLSVAEMLYEKAKKLNELSAKVGALKDSIAFMEWVEAVHPDVLAEYISVVRTRDEILNDPRGKGKGTS